jgi:hypothetical protein
MPLALCLQDLCKYVSYAFMEILRRGYIEREAFLAEWWWSSVFVLGVLSYARRKPCEVTNKLQRQFQAVTNS